MRVVHSPLHARHDGGLELHRGELVPSFEMPARVDYILAALDRAGLPVEGPRAFPEETLRRVHDADFVEFLRTAHAQWRAAGKQGSMLPSGFPARAMRQDRIPAGINGRMGYYAFDAGTPIVEGTWDAALAAAHCALTAAALVAEGERSAYALCRPPGHHAGRSVYGGYCYLNNAALAAQHLRDLGSRKVAILDVDYHHGNGTQDIFYARDDVLFVSIHGTPDTEYPYFLGYADERGSWRGRGLHPQLSAARWHRLDGVPGRPGTGAGRHRPLWCRCPGGVAGRGHVRGRSDQRLQAAGGRLPTDGHDAVPPSVADGIRAGRRLRGGGDR